MSKLFEDGDNMYDWKGEPPTIWICEQCKAKQAEIDRLREALEKIMARERGCHRHGLGEYTSWRIAKQALKAGG